MAVADSLNSRDHQDHMVAVRKLEKVRRALGEVEFTEATSEVKETWDKRFADLKETIVRCKNYDGESHDHSLCRHEADRIAAIASSSLGLTKNQVMLAVQRGLHIGMRTTTAQAIFSGGPKLIKKEGEQEHWELDRMILVFEAGLLHTILPR